MGYSVNRTANEVVVYAQYADVSAAGSAFAVAPIKGHITRIYSALQSAITGADSAVTVEINGTAITSASLTVAYSSSAGGDIDSYEIDGVLTDETNRVAEGDTIEFISNGNSSTTAIINYYAVIQGGTS